VAYVPLPSWSPSYDPTAVSPLHTAPPTPSADLVAAAGSAGQSGWMLPNAKSNYAIKLLSPDETANPVAYQIAVEARRRSGAASGSSSSLQTFDAPTTRRICQAADFDAGSGSDYQLGLDSDVSPPPAIVDTRRNQPGPISRASRTHHLTSFWTAVRNDIGHGRSPDRYSGPGEVHLDKRRSCSRYASPTT